MRPLIDRLRETAHFSEDGGLLMEAANALTPRTITTLGDLWGLEDGSAVRDSQGRLYEFRGRKFLRPDSMTCWDPLVEWLPVTVLDAPAVSL